MADKKAAIITDPVLALQESLNDAERATQANPMLFRLGASYALTSGDMIPFMAGFSLAYQLLEAQAIADVLAGTEAVSK